jgi:hypothetical protein
MIRRNIIRFSLITLISFSISSCTKVKNFKTEGVKWFIPFNKLDTAIFISRNMELDTIVFYIKVAASDTVRDVRGFYNTNYLTVPYKMTKGSYHQFALMGNGQGRYEQNILNLSKTSSENKTFEITFLGTIFNGKELSNIKQIEKDVYYFDSRKATYRGMDEERGKAINDFTFDIKIGITKYTDERNVEWIRKINSN